MHNKQSVLLQVQGHTVFLLLLLYCAVLLNAKLYAWSDDVAKLYALSVNGPTCMVPYYNSSICYCHHFEHLFLLDQINFNVYILMLVVNLTLYINILYLFIVRPVLLLRGCRKTWGRHMLLIVYGSERLIYLNFI